MADIILSTLSNAISFWLLVAVSIFLVVGVPIYIVLRAFVINGVPCKSKERLDGKTVIITGCNTGIGKETALDLACRGARVILACRNTMKGIQAVREIKVQSGSETVLFKRLDLTSCKSIREFARQILEEEARVDILICNAGVLFLPYQLTEDGFECTFGVNHLGHFLLTNLLLDRIRESAPSRIIMVSSRSHFAGSLDFTDMMWTKHYNRYLAYCRSKLANVMFARELAKRVLGTGVTVCALHPGAVNTDLYLPLLSGWMTILRPLAYSTTYLMSKTPKQGAQTSIHCAVAKEVEGTSGKYWDNCAIKEPTARAKDDQACRQLWEYSAKAVGLHQ